MATYTKTPSGDIVLCLTLAEAKGLYALADEGAGALLTDAAAGSAYIGNSQQVAAAQRAYEALGLAAK